MFRLVLKTVVYQRGLWSEHEHPICLSIGTYNMCGEAERIHTITSSAGKEHPISWGRMEQLHRTEKKAQDKDKHLIKTHRVETQPWNNERLGFIALELTNFNVSWDDWIQWKSWTCLKSDYLFIRCFCNGSRLISRAQNCCCHTNK